MTDGQARLLVAVLGMHRSGTSALARGLQVFGVSLGERLMPAGDDNVKGFWEDLDVVALNDRALASLGRSWASLTPVSPQETQRLDEAGFVVEAAALLRTRLAAYPRFGFKDPRCARLGGLWREAMRRAGAPAAVAIMLRHPLSVADSLRARDGLGLERSVLLWLDYTLSSLVHSVGLPRRVIDYDQLIQAPEVQIRRLGELLGLVPNAAAQEEFSRRFLDERLRHARYGDDDLSRFSRIVPLVADVYRELQCCARDEVSLDDPLLIRRCQGWWDEFDRWRLALIAADAPDTVEQRAARRAIEQARDLEDRLLAVQAALREANERVAATQAALEQSQQLALSRAEEVAALTARLDRTQAALEQTQTLAVERAARIDGLQAALEQAQGIAAQHYAALREANERVAAMQAALTQVQLLAQVRYEELSQVQRRLEDATGKVADLEAMVAELQGRLEGLERQHAEVLGSLSWRVTSPLRWLHTRLRAL